MSVIAGFVGEGDPSVLAAMLAASGAPGGEVELASGPGSGLGVRVDGGLGGLHRGAERLVAWAGEATLGDRRATGAELDAAFDGGAGLAGLDGAFGLARWDPRTRALSLAVDPFGVRGLCHAWHGGVFYFASELKQLLAIHGLDLSLDASALHRYLTFSFVPGEATPLRAVRRLLPGHVATLAGGALLATRWFELVEDVDPAFVADEAMAVRAVRRAGRRAVERRLEGRGPVGLYLSGGLDSSAVGAWLVRSGAAVRAFSLDFGERSVERAQASEVARHLGVELELVPVSGLDVAESLDALVYALDLPFGDAVTGPQLALARAARRAGLEVVFNGEGGDQLFGGWTSKPMVAASLYGELHAHASREELYLQSYHRFYGHEDALYTPDFHAAIGGPGQRRALLAPHLGATTARTFLNRMRLADIALKGSHSILPRAQRLAGSVGLAIEMPLFDRALAELSFRIPPQQKLHGACEKYVLKRALQRALPEEIVWRRKFGMSVPVTDWVQGPLAGLVADHLGPEALRRRGLFRPEHVARIVAGEDEPGEPRRRRLGEKVWALVMLEAWLRVFVDRRGRRP